MAFAQNNFIFWDHQSGPVYCAGDVTPHIALVLRSLPYSFAAVMCNIPNENNIKKISLLQHGMVSLRNAQYSYCLLKTNGLFTLSLENNTGLIIEMCILRPSALLFLM